MAPPGKTLSDLGLLTSQIPPNLIYGLAVDSREVRKGYLFVALPGSQTHGAKFANLAFSNGAIAILTDPEGSMIAAEEIKKFNIEVCILDDPRGALAHASALFYGSQPEVVVAVTGTNGKTSVASFCQQIWTNIGMSAISLGTIGIEGSWSASLSHTTPDPIVLHRVLAQAKRAGVTHVAMEASSHGLDQKRLDGVTIQVAGFTNFSQDHLDYHQTFEKYFAAKAGLFDRVLGLNGTAVINLDDPKGTELKQLCVAYGHKVISVGHVNADLQIQGQKFDGMGQEILFSWQGKTQQVRVPLVGGFQGENLMLASAMVLATGVASENVFAALNAMRPVRGRMELAATRSNGASIFVDYAHTPDALATALKSLRRHAMGRLVVVFGAGGDRDHSKRKLMGQVASEFADYTFLTDDNPRNEEPSEIRAMVLAGAPNSIEVADRAEAILRAVDFLQAGDTLLIAGKGHESGQIVGSDILPFDDVEQASIAVAALEGAY